MPPHAQTTLATLIAFVFVGLVGPQVAIATPPARTRLVGSGFTAPIAIAHAPIDAGEDQAKLLFVCERAGTVRILHTETGDVLPASPGAFLDITPLVSTALDNGLLGMAFDPDYATNRFFYVNYNATDGHIVLARYRVLPQDEAGDPLVADPTSATIIWRYPRPLGHNGGWIGFSPINDLLYITSGDGDQGGTFDAANRAQTVVDQRMGKVLRIDPSADDFPAELNRNYRIPPNNPFIGAPGDDEIWAYGVRNPWRASFDRDTGNFWFGDVGMDSYEEIDFEPADSLGGHNFGWPCMEGTHCTQSTLCVCNEPSLTLPVHEVVHPEGRSITGGYVYRGTAIPALQGHYFFGDFLASRIWSFVPPAVVGQPITQLVDRSDEFTPAGTTRSIRYIATFGEDAEGELYVADIVFGNVYKVVPYPCAAVVDLSPTPQVRPAGSTVVLGMLGAGQEPLTFRWRRNGIEVEASDRVTGADTAALTIHDAEVDDSGLYDVVLSSPCGGATSAAAELTVFVCRSADVNDSGQLTVQDILDYLTLFFTAAPGGDFNQSGNISVQDILDFLTAYFAGCV